MSHPEEQIVRALVRGVRPGETEFAPERLRAVARYHRVSPLIVDRWSDDPSMSRMVDVLRPLAAEAAARDMDLVAAMTDSLEVCDSIGARCLVIKGAAFGPLLYGRSDLRPRLDVDLWVDGWDAAESVADAMQAEGFRREHQLPGRLARHAISLSRRSPSGAASVDLHARSSRRVRVARAFDFATAAANAEPFQVGEAVASTPAASFAFGHATLHLTSHHAGHVAPWIHLEDLARLAVRIGPDEWELLLARVRENELISAFADGLSTLRGWAPGAVPGWVLAALADHPADASARFSHPLSALRDDLQLLPARQAARYLRELAFPPADYLTNHFGTARNRPTALLWGWRWLEGVRKRVTDSR